VPPVAASQRTLPPVEGLVFPRGVGILSQQGRYLELVAI
jgi:hypothetical protein